MTKPADPSAIDRLLCDVGTVGAGSPRPSQ